MNDLEVREEFERQKITLEGMFQQYSIFNDLDFATYNKLQIHTNQLINLATSYGQPNTALLIEINFFQCFKSTLYFMWKSFEHQVKAWRVNGTQTIGGAVNSGSFSIYRMLDDANKRLREIIERGTPTEVSVTS